jgi:hypothetical protein
LKTWDLLSTDDCVRGTVNLSPSGRPSWHAEDDAGTEFMLLQQPR